MEVPLIREDDVLGDGIEFPSTQGQGKAKVTWGAGIQTSNFFGIDINPFAVELAKVTLNIAKKIAFDDRREFAADLVGQVEIETDPSLPLDNLDNNVVSADALFTDWPEVEAIVGNPPFLGGTMVRRELGIEYLDRLHARFPGVNTGADFCSYWFRRAHDNLGAGGRAGLVGTAGIRVGKAREASLDYIVTSGGTITNAVSSRVWPGAAAVDVSMVNWIRGGRQGPFELIVDDQVFEVARIASHLQLHADTSEAVELSSNDKGSSEGVKFDHEAFRAPTRMAFPFATTGNETFLRPVATGDDLLRGRLSLSPEVCVYLAAHTEDAARREGESAFEYLRIHVYPSILGRVENERAPGVYAAWIRRWWKPWAPREQFFARMAGRSRALICPKVSARPSFAFISVRFVPNNTLQVFALDDDYSFGMLQSGSHWTWTKRKGGRVRADIRYTNDVWRTFPWPQEPRTSDVISVAQAARHLRHTRTTMMEQNGWSLRALYQAAEISGPHPLKDAQAALDEAVQQAYGMPADAEPTEFLLELNKFVAEDEAAGRPVQGPGVPRGLDPRDPRWMSDDCIEPPRS